MSTLDEIEAKARAASDADTRDGRRHVHDEPSDYDIADAEFHAALNPTVALALIRVAKAAQAMATDCDLKEPIPGTSYWSYAPSLVKPIPLGQALQALTRAMEGMK